MTRTYALKRLLEHGPLPWAEISEIMGGNKNTLEQSLRRLVAYGIVRHRNINKKRHYELSELQ